MPPINCEKISHVAKMQRYRNCPNFSSRLKCTKFDFETPLGELKALPRPLAGFKGSYLGREGKGGEKRRGR